MITFKSYINERCWTGYKPVPGKKPYSKGSCKKEDMDYDIEVYELEEDYDFEYTHVAVFKEENGQYIDLFIDAESDEDAAEQASLHEGIIGELVSIEEEVEDLEEAKHYPYSYRATYHDPDTNKVTHYMDFKHKSLDAAKKHAQHSRLQRKDGKEDKLHSVIQVKEEVLDEKAPAWQRKEGKSKSGGLNRKGVMSYRRANPGSKLKTAVTTKPSKLKKGSKAAKRRKSFCSRMKGMKRRLTGAKKARDPNSRINKALRKWNCR